MIKKADIVDVYNWFFAEYRDRDLSFEMTKLYFECEINEKMEE